MCICVNLKKNTLYDQLVAKRWSPNGGMTQISMFYPVSENDAITDMTFVDMAHQLQNAVEATAYADEVSKKDRNGLGFPDATSVTGKVTISSDKTTLETSAYGVEGDFFIFHPINLLNGAYLTDDDIMDDEVVLDEDCAWKLFGSPDISGKTITIGGVPHIVKGVVKKETGKFAVASGLNGPMCFLSLNSLKKYGNIYGSYNYEIILPEPVDGFALKLINEKFSTLTERVLIVENSYRFDYRREMDVILDRGIRSMNTGGMILPYYENIARGYEDIFSIVYLWVTLIVICNLMIIAVDIYRFIGSGKFDTIKKQIKHNLILIIKKQKERRNYEKD